MSHPWLVAAFSMIVIVVPSAVRALTGDLADRLVALELVSMNVTVAVVMLAEALHRTILYGIALSLALLSLATGLVFVRFLERWF